jgi:hypothetical protein
MSNKETIRNAIRDGRLSLRDTEGFGEKGIEFGRALTVAARRGAKIDEDVQGTYNIDQRKNGTVSWSADLPRSSGNGTADWINFVSGNRLFGQQEPPKAGTGWAVSGEDEQGGSVYSYYGNGSQKQKEPEKPEKNRERGGGMAPQAAQSGTGTSTGFSFDIGDYSQSGSSWSPDEPTFKADITPSLYDGYRAGQSGESSQSGEADADEPNGNLWDNSWQESGGKRFAASAKFREALDQRMGLG